MKEKTFGKAKLLLPGLTILFLCFLTAVSGHDSRLVPTPAGEDSVSEALSAADGKLDLNTADAAELETLPGIGPALARRIVEHREVYGPFARIEELTAVSGISWELLDALEPFITTDGGGNE